MASTAATPTSLVEITVSCRNLRDTDVFSKSDPICVLFHQPFGKNQWAELQRTECVQNSLNPDFATKIPINYHFEEQQRLKFMVYDIDSTTANLEHHDFLGEYECHLAHLVNSSSVTKPLVNKKCSGNCGTITIVTEELSTSKEELTIQLVGRKIENRSWFSSISPFLEFYKAIENGHFLLVHRTEPVRSSQNPAWKEFRMPLRTFCSGDYDLNLKVICRSHKSSGNHKLIGAFHTTVRKLIEGPGSSNTYWIIHEERKKQRGSSYKNSGEVVLNKAQITQVYSFMDYLRGGMEINAFIGIDFTASNGNPQSPQSLHYIHPSIPNQYVQAISSVGEIIEDYDTDKFFPVLGFGAKLPPDHSTVFHEFFVNGDASNPFCHRVKGVIEAYCACLTRIQLFGPTNFAPIINHVARFATSHQSGDKYFILLILTDGIITDMPQTKEAIVNASNLPLSIIIVGVGQAEFDSMEELDGDVVRISSHGRFAARDIVQFVPFRDFMKGVSDPIMAKMNLAREVLAEVPGQVISFMKANNISPQPPKVNDAFLPQLIE